MKLGSFSDGFCRFVVGFVVVCYEGLIVVELFFSARKLLLMSETLSGRRKSHGAANPSP